MLCPIGPMAPRPPAHCWPAEQGREHPYRRLAAGLVVFAGRYPAPIQGNIPRERLVRRRMSRLDKRWKALASSVGFLGVAILAGVGLASYTESGAFSFYKQQRPVEWADPQAAGLSEPALTRIPTSPSLNTIQYRDWTPAPSVRGDPLIVDEAIANGDYVTWTEDSHSPEADLEPVPDMPRAGPEPGASQVAMETSMQIDGAVPNERQTAASVDGPGGVDSTANEPLEGIEDPQN